MRMRVRPGIAGICASMAAVLSVAACASNPASGGSARKDLVPVTVGLTYIPNIQFSPFYVADAKGFFTDAGLSVTLHHHTLAEAEFGPIEAGKEDVVYAGGDEILQARNQKIPITYVADLYQKYPVGLIVPKNSPIRTLSDLRGRTIGVPGAYGETYFGLLALLQSAGLSMSDVHIKYIGFTQVSALLGHKVDAVMGYVNNEAVQLQLARFPVRTFALSSTVRPLPLIADGLAVRTSYLHAHAAAIKALIGAVMRAENFIAAHPAETLDISKAYIPGLAAPATEAQAAKVLAASIPLWQPISANGYSAPSAWRGMATFMLAHRFISKPANLAQSYSNSFLP